VRTERVGGVCLFTRPGEPSEVFTVAIASL
jgi:hypothetical protein